MTIQVITPSRDMQDWVAYTKFSCKMCRKTVQFRRNRT